MCIRTPSVLELADGAGRGGVPGEVGGGFRTARDLELGQDRARRSSSRSSRRGGARRRSPGSSVPSATSVRMRSSCGESRASFSSFIRCLPLRSRSSTALVTAGSSRESPAPTARIARRRSSGLHLLQHVPGRAGHDRGEQRLVVGERGEHQHPGRRGGSPGSRGSPRCRCRRRAGRPSRRRRDGCGRPRRRPRAPCRPRP